MSLMIFVFYEYPPGLSRKDKMTSPQDGPCAYLTAVAVAVLQSCMMGTFAAYSVFVHHLSRDASLGFPSQTTLSLAQSFAQAVMIVAGVAAGAASDRFGVRPVLLFAGIVLLMVNVLSPLASNAGEFIAVYAVTLGLCLGAISAPGPAAIGSWFSESRVSVGMGIGEAGVALGTALLPLCAGFLLSTCSDWRVAMRYMALFAVPPIVLSGFIVQRPHDGSAGDAKEGGCPGAEAGDGAPGSSLQSLLLTRRFGLIFACQTLFGLGYFGWIFVSVPYAQAMGSEGTAYAGAVRIGVEKASALLTYFGLSSAGGALVLGGLGSRLPVRGVLCASALLGGGAVGACAVAREYWQLAALYAFLGICFAGGLTCLPSMVAEGFAGPHLNKVMSVSFVGFGIGGIAGPPLLSWLQEHVACDGSYTNSFAMGASCMGAVGVLSGGTLLWELVARSPSDGAATKLLN